MGKTYDCGVATEAQVEELFERWCPTMDDWCRTDCMHIYKDGTTTVYTEDDDGNEYRHVIPRFGCRMEPELHCYH